MDNGAIAALQKLIASKKPIILLSNTPRPMEITRQKIAEWGIDTSKVTIYTSGDAVREQLFSTVEKKIFHLGAERNQDILQGLNVITVDDIQEADFVPLTIYMDEGKEINRYDSILQQAKDRNLTVMCANPDVTVNHGNKIRYCAGTFAQQYKDLGSSVDYYSKPDKKVFTKVLSLLGEYGVTDKSRILMIGETMETDILGATSAGIDSVLLLTGNGMVAAQDINHLKKYSFQLAWISPSLSS